MPIPHRNSHRLLFLSAAFSGGGAEYVSQQMHDAFPNEPFILFSNDDESSLPSPQVKIIPSIERSIWGKRFLNNCFRLLYVQLFKIRLGPSITISHLEGPNFINLLTLGGGRRIIFVHNVVSRNYKNKTRTNTIKLFLVKLLYRNSDRIVAVSTQVQRDLIENFSIHEKRVLVLPNPINIDQIRAASEAYDYPWKSIQKGNYAVCVASLTEQKNHHLLLNIFANYKKRYHTGHLFLIGDGPYHGPLVKHCDLIGLTSGPLDPGCAFLPDVVFCGFVFNPYPLIKNASALVLTSFWEGQPIVVLEALALGIPFLTTNSTPFFFENLGSHSVTQQENELDRDGFVDTGCGVVFPPAHPKGKKDNIDPWVHYLHQIFSGNEPRGRCSKKLTDQFDTKQVKRRWEELFFQKNN
jgi:glycosyltransferase involved in cell wall biosynthesis